MAGPVRWLLLAAMVLLVGCYKSHGRGDPGRGPAMDGGLSDADPQTRSGGGMSGGGGGPGGGGASGGGQNEACEPFRARATQAELDIFVLKDASRSMALLTEADLTKGTVVNEALRRLFLAEESTGLGVTMTLFPFVDRDVGELCVDPEDCGRGACVRLSTCFPEAQVLCVSDAECGAGESCLPRGRCGRSNTPCIPGGAPCADSRVECIPVGFCAERTPCDPDIYRERTTPVEPAPRTYADTQLFFGDQDNDGGTPMYPALAGIIEAARAHARENPSRRVVALLATDGLPSSCDPTLPYGLVFEDEDVPRAIGSIADVAAEGLRRGVPTYVVGVFAPDEGPASVSSLNRIAAAGGTDRAALVPTDVRVIDQLSRALASVRDEARECAFAVPSPGGLPDPDTLTVRILANGAATDLPRRATAADCDDDGGFHFAEELAAGERSGLVELCPTSCAQAQALGAEVEMEVVCEDG